MSALTSYLTPALEYHASGLVIVPFYRKAAGGVTFPAWEKYRDGQTAEQVRELFARPSDGIALLCVGGVECIDIDVKHDPQGTIGKEWFDYANLWLSGSQALPQCVVQKTKSNGWHVLYRTNIHEGNQKLAHRAGSREAIIETRGKGGLVFIAPTPGYEVKRGDLRNIQLIDDKARECFMRCARELSDRDDAETVSPMPSAAPPQASTTPERPAGDVRPGDDFNAQHDVQDLAERYGWKVSGKAGHVVHLSKPGATHAGDIHASIVTTKAGERRFYPFTTATAYDANKCYAPFAMYAIEEHRGDHKAAAKALYEQGFGTRHVPAVKVERAAPTQPPAAPQVPAETPTASALPELVGKVAATRFDFHAPIREAEPILRVAAENKVWKVAARGQIGVWTGHEKSGKSFVLECVAASAIGPRRECLNFSLDLQGGHLMWCDNEQSSYFFNWNQKRVHRFAGLSTNSPQYAAYHLRKLTPHERLAVIEHLVYSNPNLVALVLDGYVDLVDDYNNLEKVQALVARLMRWSDERNILILGVLHVNKGDGKVRGHLGSELKNKCDFIVNVSKDDAGVYTISNPSCRYGEWPTSTFTRNEQGDPVYRPLQQLTDHAPF
jgi:hypothetical protein